MPNLILNLNNNFIFGELYEQVKRFAEENNIKLYDVKIELDTGHNNVEVVLST